MPEQPEQQQQQMTPEQVEELKEKIKNMSPEELREFQKKQCIFCHIVEGKVQAKKIYDDAKCIGILDINPCNPGHVLLLPKEHYAIMPQLPEDILKHLFVVAKAISSAQLKALEASGTNILVANGPAAGQKAQHFMIHVIPRKEDDDVGFSIPQRKMDEKSLSQVQAAIAKKMGVDIKEKPAVPKPPGIETPEQTPPESKIPEPPKPKIVEAEFKEEKPKKAVVKKKPKKKQDIDLDDIANVLGVK